MKECIIPKEWNTIRLQTFKKNDKANIMENQRGISITNAVSKVFKGVH